MKKATQTGATTLDHIEARARLPIRGATAAPRRRGSTSAAGGPHRVLSLGLVWDPSERWTGHNHFGELRELLLALRPRARTSTAWVLACSGLPVS
eukprot:5577427-Heterocapsa_arctica.AAC.1